MTFNSYRSKTNYSSMWTTLRNGALREVINTSCRKYESECKDVLLGIIANLRSNPLIGLDTEKSIEALEKSLAKNIEVLFASECDAYDLQFFRLQFERSLRVFENDLILKSNDNSWSAAIERLYLTTVKPLLMKLLGIILGIFLSPVLPFSSTARDYVGSFFRSHLGNTLYNEFKDLRSKIEKHATEQNHVVEEEKITLKGKGY
ncbi:MAG: hypothetical protein NTU48_08415 [Legionellales bacterium]|nr:hypothetical protein [Legionellales bacterium]